MPKIAPGEDLLSLWDKSTQSMGEATVYHIIRSVIIAGTHFEFKDNIPEDGMITLNVIIPDISHNNTLDGTGKPDNPLRVIPENLGLLAKVFHDNTMYGEGTANNPLGVNSAALNFLVTVAHDNTLLGTGRPEDPLRVNIGALGLLSYVAHDNTLAGAGTPGDPLRINSTGGTKRLVAFASFKNRTVIRGVSQSEMLDGIFPGGSKVLIDSALSGSASFGGGIASYLSVRGYGFSGGSFTANARPGGFLPHLSSSGGVINLWFESNPGDYYVMTLGGGTESALTYQTVYPGDGVSPYDVMTGLATNRFNTYIERYADHVSIYGGSSIANINTIGGQSIYTNLVFPTFIAVFAE